MKVEFKILLDLKQKKKKETIDQVDKQLDDDDDNDKQRFIVYLLMKIGSRPPSRSYVMSKANEKRTQTSSQEGPQSVCIQQKEEREDIWQTFAIATVRRAQQSKR